MSGASKAGCSTYLRDLATRWSCEIVLSCHREKGSRVGAALAAGIMLKAGVGKCQPWQATLADVRLFRCQPGSFRCLPACLHACQMVAGCYQCCPNTAALRATLTSPPRPIPALGSWSACPAPQHPEHCCAAERALHRGSYLPHRLHPLQPPVGAGYVGKGSTAAGFGGGATGCGMDRARWRGPGASCLVQEPGCCWE